MSQHIQDNRFLSIQTQLEENKLLLTSIQGTEYISDLYEFQIELLSDDHEINPTEILGSNVTLTINSDTNRVFNGIINRFVVGELKSDNLRQYKANVVPFIWLLSKTNNYRIFQEMTVEDIIKTILDQHCYSDYRFELDKSYPKRDYCTQFNESDLHFIQRLLEEEGISYYFQHTIDSHELIFLDLNANYSECAENNVEYSKGMQPGSQINSWNSMFTHTTSEWSIRDYNYLTADTVIDTKESSCNDLQNNQLTSHYEYMPYISNMTDTSRLTEAEFINYSKNRILSLDARFNIKIGSSDCSSFFAGGKFTLAVHDIDSERGVYILSSISHSAYDNSYMTNKETGSGYQNRFNCISIDNEIIPDKRHNKSKVYGPLSAVIVGADGDEIYTDLSGRVKAQFLWDREGGNNQNSSCYIRVSQIWSGNQWGALFLPRVGQEVIVSFINGDPDRPIITGSVYNSSNQLPFETKTQSGIKSRSTLEGGADNANIIMFDDLKDQEQLYIQAEKDQIQLIKNDNNINIINDQNIIIENNQYTEITTNRSITIHEGDDILNVSSGNNKVTVKNKSTLDADKIVLTAKSAIELVVGGSTIKIDNSGITIKGTKVEINGTMAEVKGSGMVTVKGGLTKIN